MVNPQKSTSQSVPNYGQQAPHLNGPSNVRMTMPQQHSSPMMNMMAMRFNPYFIPLQGVPTAGYGQPPQGTAYMMPPGQPGAMMQGSPVMMPPSHGMMGNRLNAPQSMLRGHPMNMIRGPAGTVVPMMRPPVPSPVPNRPTPMTSSGSLQPQQPQPQPQPTAIIGMPTIQPETPTLSTAAVNGLNQAMSQTVSRQDTQRFQGQVPVSSTNKNVPAQTTNQALHVASPVPSIIAASVVNSNATNSLPPPSSLSTIVPISVKIDPLATKKILESILEKRARRKNGYTKASDPLPIVDLTPAQERKLINISNAFLHRTLEQTCLIAKLRHKKHSFYSQQSPSITFEDLAFVLDSEYGISLPPPLIDQHQATTSNTSVMFGSISLASLSSENSPLPKDCSASTSNKILPKRRPMPLMPAAVKSGSSGGGATKKTTSQKRKASNLLQQS